MSTPIDKARSELHEYADWIEREIARVRGALVALTGSPPRPAVRPESARVRALAALRGDPTATWTAQDVTEAALRAGWATASDGPVNVIRAALARMVDEGLVERVSVGHFRLGRPR